MNSNEQINIQNEHKNSFIRALINKSSNIFVGIYILYLVSMIVINLSMPDLNFRLHSWLWLTLINDTILHPIMILIQCSLIIYLIFLFKGYEKDFIIKSFKITTISIILSTTLMTGLFFLAGGVKGVSQDKLNQDIFKQMLDHTKENRDIDGAITLDVPIKIKDDISKLKLHYNVIFDVMYIAGSEYAINELNLDILEQAILEQTAIKEKQQDFLY